MVHSVRSACMPWWPPKLLRAVRGACAAQPGRRLWARPRALAEAAGRAQPPQRQQDVRSPLGRDMHTPLPLPDHKRGPAAGAQGMLRTPLAQHAEQAACLPMPNAIFPH